MIVYLVFGAAVTPFAALYSLACRLHDARPRLVVIRRRGRHAAPRAPKERAEKARPALEVANA